MNRPIDEDGEYYERRADPNRSDREISLGTATILGIFFGLAVVCACFFGFGYTMGHNSARAAEAAVVATPESGAIGGGSPKPAAGSLASHAVSPARETDPATGATESTQAAAPQAAGVSVALSSAKSTVAPSDRIIAGDKVPVAAAPLVSSSPQATGSYMVQVAAVSSQDVADILLGSLEKKGYSVGVHHEPQDKLLHVQIGPFADRKQAEVMQKRVLADGFNAIVK